MAGRSMLGVCLGFAAVTYSMKVSRESLGREPQIGDEDRDGDAITERYKVSVGGAEIDVTASCLDGSPSVSIDGHGAVLDERIQAKLRSGRTSMLESLRETALGACNPAHIIATMLSFLAKAPQGYALKQISVSNKATGWVNVSVCLNDGDTEHAYWDDANGDNHSAAVIVGSSDGNFFQKGNCLDDTFNKTRYTQRCLNYDECCAENHGTIGHMVTNCINEYFDAMGDLLVGAACDVYPGTPTTNSSA